MHAGGYGRAVCDQIHGGVHRRNKQHCDTFQHSLLNSTFMLKFEESEEMNTH